MSAACFKERQQYDLSEWSVVKMAMFMICFWSRDHAIIFINNCQGRHSEYGCYTLELKNTLVSVIQKYWRDISIPTKCYLGLQNYLWLQVLAHLALGRVDLLAYLTEVRLDLSHLTGGVAAGLHSENGCKNKVAMDTVSETCGVQFEDRTYRTKVIYSDSDKV